ncbi:hypothetical protein F2P81_000242 [Scophthalmus maximus]|uniref:Uncharacterized protein n=1 Tax=Scophthalmus maximus TaxID=52904 RepID=A0A6A4TP31_SCOMX|nr:hypothetical protein F2P81_000242 [Scophthalmus maximus]
MQRAQPEQPRRAASGATIQCLGARNRESVAVRSLVGDRTRDTEECVTQPVAPERERGKLVNLVQPPLPRVILHAMEMM